MSVLSGFLKAEHNTYLEFSLPKLVRQQAINKPDIQLDKLLPKAKSCKVCGLGALFVCMVKKEDKFEAERVIGLWNRTQLVNHYELKSYLEDLFNPYQLKLIEAAFENWSHMVNFMSDKRYSAKRRLIAVMENIIENDGDFVLE